MHKMLYTERNPALPMIGKSELRNKFFEKWEFTNKAYSFARFQKEVKVILIT